MSMDRNVVLIQPNDQRLRTTLLPVVELAPVWHIDELRARREERERRPLRVTDKVAEWIDTWRSEGFTDDTATLFPVLEGKGRGRKLNAAYFRSALHALTAKAGVDKRVHPHCFRHCLAVDMDRRGIALAVISRQLRHASVATTATYLRKINDSEVFDSLAEMEWADMEATTGLSVDDLDAQIADLLAMRDSLAVVA